MKKIDVHLHASSAAQARESMAYLRKKGVARAILMSVDNTALNREICAQSPDLHWMCNLSDTAPETVFDRLSEHMVVHILAVGTAVGHILEGRDAILDEPHLQSARGVAVGAKGVDGEAARSGFTVQ